MVLDWSYFNSIYCINLYEREDRYNHCKNLFDQLNIQAQFYRTTKHKKGGAYGCYESHLACIEKSYNAGNSYCLIFEDDIDTEYITNDYINEIVEFTKQSDWDILFLGSLPHINRTHKKINKYIVHGPCYLTHAYIINRSFMETMLNRKHLDEDAIDKIYVDIANSFHFYPNLFYANNYESDIETSAKPHRYSYYTDNFIHFYCYHIGLQLSLVIIILIIFFLIILVKVDRHYWILCMILSTIFLISFLFIINKT